MTQIKVTEQPQEQVLQENFQEMPLFPLPSGWGQRSIHCPWFNNQPRASESQVLILGPRICISNKFPGDAAGVDMTYGYSLLYRKMQQKQKAARPWNTHSCVDTKSLLGVKKLEKLPVRGRHSHPTVPFPNHTAGAQPVRIQAHVVLLSACPLLDGAHHVCTQRKVLEAAKGCLSEAGSRGKSLHTWTMGP